MTIYLYTGTPGSGKSLHMAAEIYWHVRMKRRCICNFEIDKNIFKDGGKAFVYVENDELDFEYLEQSSRDYFANHPYKEGSLKLYIDEAQLLFNARDWNSASRKDWIKFFTQHRKLGYDVYLITQFDTMLDKQIRALIEYEYKHRKLNNIGWVGKCASLLALGHPVIVCVKYWYPLKERLAAEWIIGRRRFYRLYDTTKIFG